VRVRWNVAKHFRALVYIDPDADDPPGCLPWKGEWRERGGSDKWPDDDAFEYCFGREASVMPGIEEVSPVSSLSCLIARMPHRARARTAFLRACVAYVARSRQ
jgi:hypothetical protein